MSLQPPIETDLFQRMKQGDRKAAAEFMAMHSERIRRCVTGIVPGPLRGWLDTDDLISTVALRMDREVTSGNVAPRSIYDVMRHVKRLANEALINYESAAEVLPHHDDKALSTDLLEVMDKHGVPGIQEVLDLLQVDERAFMILVLRGNSVRHAIAPMFNMTYEQASMKALRLRRALNEIARTELRDAD